MCKIQENSGLGPKEDSVLLMVTKGFGLNCAINFKAVGGYVVEKQKWRPYFGVNHRDCLYVIFICHNIYYW